MNSFLFIVGPLPATSDPVPDYAIAIVIVIPTLLILNVIVIILFQYKKRRLRNKMIRYSFDNIIA